MSLTIRVTVEFPNGDTFDRVSDNSVTIAGNPLYFATEIEQEGKRLLDRIVNDTTAIYGRI